MRTTGLAILSLASVSPAQFELWTIRGSAVDERMGSAVCGVATASGSRWIVGARGASVVGLPAQTGAIRILSWNGSGCAEPWYSPVPGSATGDQFGAAAAASPSIPGNVIVGAPQQDAPGQSDAGALWRIDVATGFGSIVRTGPVGGGEAGWSVACLGDTDLDGHVDYAFGVPYGNWLQCPWYGDHRGRADVVSAGPSSRTLGTVWGAGSCSGPYVGYVEYLGWDVSPLGDVDNNGRPEFLVGSYNASSVYVCEIDATGALVTTRTDTGPSQFGIDTCPLGDVSVPPDGVPDYAAGAASAREVRVLDGATGAVLRTWVGLQPAFGGTLACVGDQDGDGIGDLLVGAYQAFSDTGEVYLFSVGSGQMLALMRGAVAGGQFGRSLAGVPDMTGDGRQELAIGAPEATINGVAQAGYAALFTMDGTTPVAQLHGTGCVPPFALGPEPWIGTPLGPIRPGTSFALSASRCLPNRSAVLVVDFSAFLPIPICLGPVVPTLAGCCLFVNPTVNVAASSTTRTTSTGPGNGFVEHVLAVPNNPIFANTPIFAQWYVVDPGPNPLSGSMTRALRL